MAPIWELGLLGLRLRIRGRFRDVDERGRHDDVA